MTIRLSTGMRDAVLDGGIRAALASGFMYIFTGSQPATADTAATGTLLGRVTVNGDGGTGLTFDAPADGVLSKAVAEAWKFTGLAEGIAGWYRFSDAADTPTNTSTTRARIDGAIGSSGADLNLSNLSIGVGQTNTVDAFTITMPAA